MTAVPGPALVTGAAGFIGNRLVRRLREMAVPVRALLLPAEPVPSGWDRGVAIVRGDIADHQSVQAAVAGCATVFHLAAVVGDWGPEHLFRKVTVEGTGHVFDAAAARGARVVLASSIVVYGHRLGTERCQEQIPMGRPYGPYSRSKQAQEIMARERIAAAGCDIRIVRPANVYGPGSRPWVDETTRLLLQNKPVLIDGGSQNAGLVYVDNVVDVMIRAAGDAASTGDVFNACDELAVTWSEYFSDLAHLVGARAPRSVPGWVAWPLATAMEASGRLARLESRPPLTREAVHLVSAHHQVPATRAREQLGHRVLVDYGEGLEAVARYLRV